MAYLLLVLSVIACYANAVPVKLTEDKHLGVGDSDIVSELVHTTVTRQAQHNEYHLYTRLNPTSSQLLLINNANSITSSNYNSNNPTIVIVHGWLDNMDASFNEVVRDVFLRKSNVNVITLDWSQVAISLYGAAVSGVPSVGRGLGQFLNFLNKVTGAQFSNMHLIGFSLGAHVVGNAGRELGGKVARITGLDPAGPLWHGNSNRLRRSDAEYVEAIHSDGSSVGLGIGSAVADVDLLLSQWGEQPARLPQPFL